ncbi:MAG: hypothetical protein Aurels2KO_21430 [Aureliella sp.]
MIDRLDVCSDTEELCVEPDGNSTPTYESAGQSNRYVIYFGIFMVVGLGTLAWIGRPPIVSARGEKLPQLDLQPLLESAEPVDNASLEGAVTVLHFWGTWCHYCKLEFPEFVELAKEFEGNQQVKIVSVSCSPGAEMDVGRLAADTRQYLSQFDVTLPTYTDAAGMTRTRVGMLLNGSLGYPTTLVVGPDGVITDTLTGYRAGDMLNLASGIKRQLKQIELQR